MSVEVHSEVVLEGIGMPGASQVSSANWIEIKPLRRVAQLADDRLQFSLGLGELSTILLAHEIGAQIVLMDDLRGRGLAMKRGLLVRGTIGIVETLFRRGEIADLRSSFHDLLDVGAFIARDLLNRRLHLFGLDPL